MKVEHGIMVPTQGIALQTAKVSRQHITSASDALGAANMPNMASGDGRRALEAEDARVGLKCRGEGLRTSGPDVIVADAASTRLPMASSAHMLTRSMLGATNVFARSASLDRHWIAHLMDVSVVLLRSMSTSLVMPSVV